MSIAGAIGGTNLTVALGGSGGDAGNAGTVTVANVGDISTGNALDGTGTQSYGIFAQSLGGGGGNGGLSFAGSAGLGGERANFGVGRRQRRGRRNGQRRQRQR